MLITSSHDATAKRTPCDTTTTDRWNTISFRMFGNSVFDENAGRTRALSSLMVLFKYTGAYFGHLVAVGKLGSAVAAIEMLRS
jgi:hypothetical protein